MKALIIDIGPSMTGNCNYVKLMLKYGKLNYDTLNASLFGYHSLSYYPSSARQNGYLSISAGPVQGLFGFYFGSMSKRIATEAEKIGHSADIVFLSKEGLIRAAALIRRKLAKPVTATIHDAWIFCWKRFHPYRFFIDLNLRGVNYLSVLLDSNKHLVGGVI